MLAQGFVGGADTPTQSAGAASDGPRNGDNGPQVALAATQEGDTTQEDTTIEQTAQSLDATATAVAHMEQTAQARTVAEARERTTTALQATEQAIAATAEALAEAQTAQAEAGSTSLLPPPTAPPPAAAGNVCDQATVIGSISQLAIQESPVIDNTYIEGTAPRGATVDVLCVEPETSDERVWVWIRYGGTEGWMSTRYLRFNQGMPVGQCNTGTVVEVAALSIREETNRGSRYLAEVPGGNQVAVLCVPQIFDDGRAWVFVHYQGIEGWMSTRYLNIQ
jgi:hypothetical protein